jgi:hypothetical protein
MHAKLTYSIVISLLTALPFSIALAARYTPSQSPCSDSVKTCTASGERIVDGFKVTKDCWEWSYIKTCTFPSKNDCSKYAHCYSLGQRDCLLRDSYGNCVNIQKEFSCKRWTPSYVESETVGYGEKDIPGQEGLICKAVPCIDGNCIDKSYEMDADMVPSVAQLAALSQGKNVNNVTFKIFEGQNRHCSKKGMEYSNCCKVFPKGWGQKLGAKCTKEEQLLSDGRSKNLCISVGSEAIKSLGLKVGTKHFYCCFGNILEKTIQVEARRQLGLDFGSGGNPNCRGLTLEELARVDFAQMDFSEVAAEMHKKIVMPNARDVEGRITNAIDRNNTFDKSTPNNPTNKTAGVNPKIRGE